MTVDSALFHLVSAARSGRGEAVALALVAVFESVNKVLVEERNKAYLKGYDQCTLDIEELGLHESMKAKGFVLSREVK